MALICGVDEAGRGPVIGPMVIVGITIDEAKESKLQWIGVKDSKLLTPKRREILFEKILGIVKGYKIEIISPSQIDAALNDADMNLNWLEAVKTAGIINKLKPNKAYIDSPSNNLKDYKNYLKNRITNKKTELIVEHKADKNHPCVGAASIIAKVTRDKEIAKIKRATGQEIGSGYTSDPITVDFLKKNYDKYPDIMRKTWAPYRDIIKNKKQKKLNNYLG